MIYAPVIIPTLNRFQHFKECVESLAACTHADKTELVIGLDYPPADKYVEGWKQIKEYIPTITGFGKVTVLEHDHNLGPADNFNSLVAYVSDHYDAWIESEDDNVFSPCFLDYMDKCLEKYKDDESIFAVSGYMYPIDFSSVSQECINIVKTQNFMPYGIGRWRNKNYDLLKNMPDHYMRYVCSHRNILRKMKSNMRELSQLVFWTKAKPELDRKCDFTFSCYCIINNKYIIHPMLSLVRNMGYDSTGDNCSVDNWHSSQKISNESTFVLKDNAESVSIASTIWYKYKDNIYFTKEDKDKISKYYKAYMIFGFTITESFLFIYSFCIKVLRKVFRIIKKIVYPYYKILKILVKELKNNSITYFPSVVELHVKDIFVNTQLRQMFSDKVFSKVQYVDIIVDDSFIKYDLSDCVLLLIESFPLLDGIGITVNCFLTDKILSELEKTKDISCANKIKVNLSLLLNYIGDLLDFPRDEACLLTNLKNNLDSLQRSPEKYYDSLNFVCKINRYNIYNINEVVAFAEKNHVLVSYDIAVLNKRFESEERDDNFYILNDELAKKMAMEFFYGLFKQTGNKKYFACFLFLRDGERYDYCPCRTNNRIIIMSDANISFCAASSKFVEYIDKKICDLLKANTKYRKSMKKNCSGCFMYLSGLNREGEKQLELEQKKERY